MIVFELTHTDNKSFLRSLAAGMNVPYNGEDFIELREPAGKGIIKVVDLADELQVLLADVTFNRYMIARRQQSEKRYYVLHFEDIDVSETARFIVDGETLQKKRTRHSVVRLTSNAFSNTEEISAHTHARVVKVFFSEAWLKKYMGLNEEASGLQQYVALKTASFDMEPLDAGYLSLMEELWNARKEDPLQNVFLKNRVTLLIERFFTRLTEKMKNREGIPGIGEDDLKRLIEVERRLVKDLSEAPPVIDELARMVNMSATRLKRCFKEVYGTGIYTYYQEMRLQKARELLLSGKYSVKETADAVGFATAGNFTAAFKKQYHVMPSSLISES